VWSVCFSPNDPNLLVSGCDDGSLSVTSIAQHIS
jgi:WD40 repeat protein